MSGILNYSCCCGGGQITTCPEWGACRPQEIWISYAYSAHYRKVIVPQAGATGAGGVLIDETESCSGTVKFLRGTGLVQGCGGVVFNPMRDYAGDFNYSKTIVTNKFFDPSTDPPFCPNICTLCVQIVPYQRSVTTASSAWNNAANPSLYGNNALIQCFQCVAPNGTLNFPQGLMTAYQRANYGVTNTQYRCNGSVQSTGSNVIPNAHAPVDAYSRPQCINATAFDQYHIARDNLTCVLPTLTAISPISYPYCVTQPTDCDSQGNIVYRESESVNDCYQLGCVNRGCYDPSLFYGCGCSQVPSCDNPFPPAGDNGCYEEHLEYTMTSSVAVTNVIP